MPELAEGAFAREASLERDDPVVHFHEPLGCDIVSGSRQGAVQAARDEVQTRADERESNLRTQHKKELADLQQQLFEAQHACKSLKDEQRPNEVLLLHGTSKADDIALQGFDDRMSGRTLYGIGV